MDWKNIVGICLINDKIIKKAEKNALPHEIDNITSNDNVFPNCEIVTDDIVDEKNPLYHDRDKLAKSLIKLYNKIKEKIKGNSYSDPLRRSTQVFGSGNLDLGFVWCLGIRNLRFSWREYATTDGSCKLENVH